MNTILARQVVVPGPRSRPVEAASRSLDPTVDIVVCIPSFRRPDHLRRTLKSVAAQRTARRYAVVVVENDAARRESLEVVRDLLGRNVLQGVCVVEPRQGNCHAINAAFETALSLFPLAGKFLMLDDDEIAAPDWLERMVRGAEQSRADVVGGPVWPEFDDPRKRSLREHPAFRPAYDQSGPVAIIYGGGNCLIRRRVFNALGLPAFDPRFNFLGGGDLDFFFRVRAARMKFHWVANALITETVPRSRTRLGWVAMRGLRIGTINYLVQRKLARSKSARAKLLLKMVALLPLSLLRALRLAVSGHHGLIALHPVLVALGSALAMAGFKPQPYKAANIC